MTRLLRTLFSGGCLFDVGARAAGWEHADGWEIDPAIAAVARLNGFDVREADVCDVDYTALRPVHHLHVSPSCKNASQANQKGKDENGEPIPRETPQDLATADAVCRAIAAHQGATFSLENVWMYRTFESFERIRAALRAADFSFDYWHLNAADYGVPQTRKRLILVARRGLCRITRPHPTHREGGDMFHAPWVGWYAAIADILHTLPPTKPAPWQLKRLPAELRESVLVEKHGMGGGAERQMIQRPAEAPVWTMRALRRQDEAAIAYIVGGGNTGDAKISSHARAADEPMFTVRNGQHGSPERALLIGAGAWDGEVVRRAADAPAFTMTSTDNSQQLRALLINSENSSRELTMRDGETGLVTVSQGGKTAPRALLVGGQYSNPNTSAERIVQHARPSSPSWTVTTGAHKDTRAAIEGRWVRMTIRALGRFQTVPDDYQGLTSEINGNGVPCLLAQRIMEAIDAAA